MNIKKILSSLLALALVFGLFLACMPASVLADNKSKETEKSEDQDKAKEDKEKEDEEEEEVPSDTVKKLFKDFDKAMAKQIGKLPKKYEKPKVGVLIISLTNPFWANMERCYLEAAEELDLDIDVQTGTTEGDTSSQLDVLMTMADMDYDVIILSPIDGSNLIPGIVKCNKNGVKVINLGPGVDLKALEEAGGHLDARITVDFAEQGQICAEDMMKRLDNKGKVAILSGLAGAGQSEGRTKGAKESFEDKKSKVDLVAVQNCDWDASLAYNATKDLVTEHPDLKGLFCCNDVMALAASEALEAEGKKDVLIYGVDYTKDAQEALKEGRMTGTMSYSSQGYCRAALQMAILLHDGKEFDENIYLPLTLITVDNIEEMQGWK